METSTLGLASTSAWEWDLVSAFWWAVHEQSAVADRAASVVELATFEDRRCGVVFFELSMAMLEGRPVIEDETFLQRLCGALYRAFPGHIGFEEARTLVEAIAHDARIGGPHKKLPDLVNRLWFMGKARQAQAELVRGAERVAEERAQDPRLALRAADDTLGKVQLILAGRGMEGAPATVREVIAAERELVENPEQSVARVSWPYPVMQRALGYILPGRMYGLTGFSGGGKSTLLANLLGGFARRGVPCIPVVTEMGEDFLRRAWAADAEVPQEVAENQLWDTRDRDMVAELAYSWGVTPDEAECRLGAYKVQYLDTLARFDDLPIQLVDNGQLTPDQVVRHLRIIRRRWPGRFVLALIDHMHDLKYPNDEADRHVGPASKLIRAFCREDGLMSAIALYQPKKPDGPGKDSAMFKPIPLQSFRGQVAQVLDAAASLYQSYVYRDGAALTRWGSPKVKYHPEHGFPWRCDRQQAEEVDAHGVPLGFVDDQHLYLKPVKQRIRRSEKAGKTFVLRFNADSGNVFELDTRHTRQGINR